MSLTVCAISDTHNKHDQVLIPPCDILIHAGDESFQGTEKEIRVFARWFEQQPARHLVWTPGNHSVQFSRFYPASLEWMREESPRTNILLDSGVTIGGLKIWGSPRTPWFHDWAYNEVRGAQIRKYWDMIPLDTDIVVTHGPPFGIMDVVSPGTLREQAVGCQDLAEKMLVVKPKLMIFGHIHEGYGIQRSVHTTYVNAAICDEYYEPANQPIVLDV